MKRFRPLATLFAVAILFIGVLGVYRMGWREGYGLAWMQAQPREENAPAPYAAPFAPWGRSIYQGRGPMLLGGHLGRLLSLGLVLLLGALFVKALMFRALTFAGWHMHKARHGGPYPKEGPRPPRHRGPHGGRGHGPWGHSPWWGHGPWCDCAQDKPGHTDEAGTEEKVAKVQGEPDAA